MKKLAVALGLVLGTATGLAGAAAFNLGGYTGPLVIQFRDFENISGGPIPAPGDQNFGVLRVTTVQDLSGNLLWTQGGSNGFLSGVFDGITVKSVLPAGAGHLNVQSTNGHMDLYLTDTALDPNQGTLGYGAGGCAVGGLCYHTVTDVGGVHFLSLDFAPGINPADGTITVNGDFNITTNPPSGTASSYLDVVGGVYASHFDTNFFPTNFGLRDLKIELAAAEFRSCAGVLHSGARHAGPCGFGARVPRGHGSPPSRIKSQQVRQGGPFGPLFSCRHSRCALSLAQPAGGTGLRRRYRARPLRRRSQAGRDGEGRER